MRLISESFEGFYITAIYSQIEAPVGFKWVKMLKNIS